MSATRMSKKNSAGRATPRLGTTFTAAQRKHAAKVVELLGPVVPSLALALGERTEVVLHDLTRVPNSIAAIGNPISGRTVGGPITDVGLRTIDADRVEDMIDCRTETVDGMLLRCSNIFFRTPDGRAVACLSINADIKDLERAQHILASLTGSLPAGGTTSDSGRPESFAASVDELTEGILRDAVAAVGVPVELMKKTHKIDVVRELEQRGFFSIREAIELAAGCLEVSRYTIYNYLNELGVRDA